jgi:serine protease Do
MKFAATFLVLSWGLLPTLLTADDKLDRSSLINWREAETAGGETELDRLSRAFVDLASKSRPAIAQIRVTGEPTKNGGQGDPQRSRGSGFFIDAQGYLLTAQHVIDKAKSLEVRLADGERLPARLIAADSQIDLAILKVQSDKELPILSLANSESIRVGDLALVFGYPFGRESSMNLGIISRAGRTYPDSASFDYIHTDAGAYSGGSGGPLLNSRGHVIGLITMASERGNMGFATPINVIKRIFPRLVSGEKLAWGWLGVQMSDMTMDQARALGVHPVKGVIVNSVLPGHSAALAGIQKQDVILSVNENHVDSPREVSRLVGGVEAGKAVRVTILRRGKTMQLTVPLSAKPEASKAGEG